MEIPGSGANPNEHRELIKEVVKEVLGSPEYFALMKTIIAAAWNDISTDTAGMMRAASTMRSAEFVMQHIPLHMGKNHFELRRDAVIAAPAEGLFLEFGVYKGYWLNEMAKVRPEVNFFGFDSFEGLPEAWELVPAGTFSLGGVMPAVESNVTLVKGWFNQTLPGFVAQHNDPVSFIHIDCDLYSSTIDLLKALRSQLRVGTQIVMDDFMVAPGWEEAEHKAFMDFCKMEGIQFKYTGWSNQPPGCSAGVVLTKV